MAGLNKRSRTQKSHPKVVNPRDVAGERKKKKKKKKKTFILHAMPMFLFLFNDFLNYCIRYMYGCCACLAVGVFVVFFSSPMPAAIQAMLSVVQGLFVCWLVA